MSLSRAAILGVVLAGAGAGVFYAAPAAADDAHPDKATCVAKLDEAQSLSSEKRLKDARSSLVVCSSEACPDVVREDCARTLVELESSMPTAVFAATLDGADVDDVKISIDGEPVSERLDGKAVAIDPGAHTARFLRAGRAAVEVRFLAREGEKNRLVSAVLGTPRAPAPEKAPLHLEGQKRSWTLPLVLAGTGALAIGGGIGLRLSADAKADDLRSSCAPTCDAAARDQLSDRIVMSNVSLAIGIGALAAATIVWLVDNH